MLHGQLTSDEKQSAMDIFARNDSDVNVLVSTSVVEVGVDVPESSICVVDGAENFGIAQLHQVFFLLFFRSPHAFHRVCHRLLTDHVFRRQIRGRIGRGSPPPGERLKECFCVLLYDDRPSATKKVDADSGQVLPPEKLLVLEGTNDGFQIAEADLALRGLFFLLVVIFSSVHLPCRSNYFYRPG